MNFRIIFATPVWSLNGVNMFSTRLVRSLIGQGVDARIIVTQPARADTKPLPVLPDIPLENLPLSRMTSRKRRWQAMIAYLEQKAPCIYVPNHDYEFSCVTPVLSNRIGTVGIVHSDDPEHYEHVHRLGTSWDAIVAVSRDIAHKVLRGHKDFSDRLVSIPHGVECPLRCPERPGDLGQPLKIVYAGSLKQYQKRILDLLAVAETMERLCVPFEMTVIGGGPEENRFKRLAGRLIACGKIRLPGILPVDKVREFLRVADVFLLCSEFEGMPLALLEAMSEGCVPVVADITSGIPELIRNGVNGFCVPVGHVERFAVRLKTLKENPQLLRRLSQAAYQTISVEGYDLGTMTRRYLDLFENVMRRLPAVCRHGSSYSILPPPRFPIYARSCAVSRVKYFVRRFFPKAKNHNALRPYFPFRCCVARAFKKAYSETFIDGHVRYLGADELCTPWVHYPPSRNWFCNLRNRFVRRGLNAYFRIKKHDVVLAEFGPTGVAVTEACRRNGIPLVVHFHGFDSCRRKEIEEFRNAYREMFAEAVAIIVVSQEMRRNLESLGAPPEKIRLNYYGVDTKDFAGAEPEKSGAVFVSVGRFVAKKDSAATLGAFRKVFDSRSDARLIMIGDGPLLKDCKRLAKSLEINQAVCFTGRVPHRQITYYLRKARAFIHPSCVADDGDSEGLPLAVLEAASTGLPVIGTRHGGIPEVVIAGHTGYLLPEGDEDQIAAAMMKLIDNPALAGEFGRNARKLICDQFSFERSMEGLGKILSAAVMDYAPVKCHGACCLGAV